MDVRRRTRGNSRRGLLLVLALLCVAAAPSDRRLVEAVRQRNLAAVNALLSTGVDVNVPQADGVTAIAWAAHWDDLDTAARLLRAGAAVDAANDYGVTPLALACLNRGAAMVDLLLEAGADPNAAQTNGETPLMTAARTGHAGVVRSLLAAGAAPDTNSTGAGQTALMWAAAEGHADVVRALLDSGADVRARSAGGFTALLFAARRGDLRSARLLVARSANVDAAAADRNSPFLTQESPDGVTPLLMAVAANHQPLARFLLDQGADPTIPDAITKRTALHVAAEDGRDEMVRLLLERGADPNAQLVANPAPGPRCIRAADGTGGRHPTLPRGPRGRSHDHVDAHRARGGPRTGHGGRHYTADGRGRPQSPPRRTLGRGITAGRDARGRARRRRERA